MSCVSNEGRSWCCENGDVRTEEFEFPERIESGLFGTIRKELVSVGGVRGDTGGGDFAERTDPTPSTGEATDDGGSCTIVGLIILGGSCVTIPESAESSLYFEDVVDCLDNIGGFCCSEGTGGLKSFSITAGGGGLSDFVRCTPRARLL